MNSIFSYQLSIFIFNELCIWCLQQWGFAISFWRATCGNSLDYLTPNETIIIHIYSMLHKSPSLYHLNPNHITFSSHCWKSVHWMWLLSFNTSFCILFTMYKLLIHLSKWTIIIVNRHNQSNNKPLKYHKCYL